MDHSDLCLIDSQKYSHYIERFNNIYPEEIVNAISDGDAWTWMQSNVPFLDCFDRKIEEIYYFRWWTYRKHIKQTPDVFVMTEFLPPVPWAGKSNTISCAAAHHLREG